MDPIATPVATQPSTHTTSARRAVLRFTGGASSAATDTYPPLDMWRRHARDPALRARARLEAGGVCVATAELKPRALYPLPLAKHASI